LVSLSDMDILMVPLDPGKFQGSNFGPEWFCISVRGPGNRRV
jgi:hypothetical protein